MLLSLKTAFEDLERLFSVLRALADLPKDLGLIFSNHSSSREFKAPFWPL